jgi:hemolysin III
MSESCWRASSTNRRPVSVTFPAGLSRRVNRMVLTATLVFGSAGCLVLAILALMLRTRGFTAACLVYGVSLVACTLCSFLYNMLETAKRRALLRYLDHAAIFLLIAGTYTPFAAGIRGPFHESLLTWVWSLALAGIALKLFLPKSHDRAFVGLYLAIGWLFVSAGDGVARAVPPLPLLFLGLGGVAYTAGAAIYARDIGRWTDPVWHGCVFAGIVGHFVAVITFCLSATAS